MTGQAYRDVEPDADTFDVEASELCQSWLDQRAV
jgi:hypothetical protein